MEMAEAGKPVPGEIEVKTLAWIQVQTVTDIQSVIALQTSQQNIDIGEAEAILLALELKANLILMDERRGRALATTYGLNMLGLLGVLLQAKQNILISSVKILMDQLIETADFRVSQQLYSMVLKAAGEVD